MSAALFILPSVVEVLGGVLIERARQEGRFLFGESVPEMAAVRPEAWGGSVAAVLLSICSSAALMLLF